MSPAHALRNAHLGGALALALALGAHAPVLVVVIVVLSRLALAAASRRHASLAALQQQHQRATLTPWSSLPPSTKPRHTSSPCRCPAASPLAVLLGAAPPRNSETASPSRPSAAPPAPPGATLPPHLAMTLPVTTTTPHLAPACCRPAGAARRHLLLRQRLLGSFPGRRRHRLRQRRHQLARHHARARQHARRVAGVGAAARRR